MISGILKRWQETHATEQLVALVHEEGVEHGWWQLDVAVMSRAVKVGEVACLAVVFQLRFISLQPHMSPFFIGCLGSYRLPRRSMFRLSSSVGLSICLTEMERTSSEDRKEKEMAVTSE